MTDEAMRRRRKLSAIMMADVCGFSRMMGENEERTVDLIRAFHHRVKARVEEFEGRVVDTSGDSLFGEFDWSRITNVLLVTGGAIVAAAGVAEKRGGLRPPRGAGG